MRDLLRRYWATIRRPSVHYSLGFLTIGGFIGGIDLHRLPRGHRAYLPYIPPGKGPSDSPGQAPARGDPQVAEPVSLPASAAVR